MAALASFRATPLDMKAEPIAFPDGQSIIDWARLAMYTVPGIVIRAGGFMMAAVFDEKNPGGL